MKLHNSRSLRFTDHAARWCRILNAYRRAYPNATFKQMSKEFNLGLSTTRRYYYGLHDATMTRFGSYTQVRLGASVPLYL